jgi:spore coat polysaccharide biosynthesis predicted glycosyltransferase SpsG
VTDHRVGFRCDASREVGVGHLVRSVALAEACREAGLDPLFLGSTGGVAFADAQLAVRELPLLPVGPSAGDLLDACRAHRLDAVVVDSYDVPPGHLAGLRAAGVPVMAIVDAPAPDLDADLLVNQNLGAERSMAVPHRGQVLAGASYALLRSAVVAARPPAVWVGEGPATDVLVVLGGTDAGGGAVLLTALLLATGRPIRVRVVAARQETAHALRELPVAAGQSVEPLTPSGDLVDAMSGSDLIVSASGGTVWEMCCLGRPGALVTVADNQVPGYTAVVASGVAAGLGTLDDLRVDRDPAVVATLNRLLGDGSLRRAYAETAYALVDGRGRDRVARALTGLLSAPAVRTRGVSE